MKKIIGIIISIVMVLTIATSSFGLGAAVKSIKSSVNKISVQIGMSYALKIEVTPSNAANKDLSYTSANTGVASVDAKGSILANGVGSTTITATSLSNKKLALKISVTVSPATIKVLLPQVEADGLNFNKDKFPILEAAQKATGVKLDLEAYASDKYKAIVDARLAARSGLPDLFVVDQTAYDIASLSDVKIIVPINNLIKQYAPNMVKFLSTHVDVARRITNPDGTGTIYGWPGRVQEAAFDSLVLQYRQDWVDAAISNFGLKFSNPAINQPLTIDDWTKMLTVFKNEGDPTVTTENKSLVVPLELWAPNKYYDFAGAYGLSAWSNWFSVVNGKVMYDFTGQEAMAKAFVTQMHNWFAAGLIDQQLGDNHNPKGDADTAGNLTGAQQEWSSYAAYWNKNNKAADGSMQNWMIAQAPVGPSGKSGYENYPDTNNERWLITSVAKNPVAVIKFLDYIFASPEGETLMNYGIEGVNYTVVDGKPVYNDTIMKNPTYTNTWSALASLGASRFPNFVLKNAADQLNSKEFGTSKELIDALNKSIAKSRYMFPTVAATKQESNVVSTKLTDINTYQNEMLLKFILGTEPLSNWGTFVSTLKKMGIDDIVAVRQAQYNRFVGSK